MIINDNYDNSKLLLVLTLLFKFTGKIWKMFSSAQMGLFIFMWLTIIASGLYVEVDKEGFCFQIPGVIGAQHKVFYESIASQSNLSSNVTTPTGTD